VAAIGEWAVMGDKAKLGPTGSLVMKIPGYRGLAEAAGVGLFGSGSEVTSGRQREFLSIREMRATQEALDARTAAIRQGGARTLFESQLSRAGFAGGANDAAGQLGGVRNQLGMLRGAGAADALGGVGNVLDRQIALRQRELDLVRQISAEQKNAAMERVRGLESELAKQREIAQAIRGQLETAAERFGQLSGVDQQRAIDAQRKLQRGERLTQDERRRLRGIGLDSVSAGVRAQDIADAEAAGFSNFFGDPERRREAAANREQQRIAVEIQREKDFVVKLEANDQQTAKFLAREIARLMVERDENLRKMTAEQVRKEIENTYAQRNRDAQSTYALSDSQQ
jgi:hypothetical protein